MQRPGLESPAFRECLINTRRLYFSYHFEFDHYRAEQVRKCVRMNIMGATRIVDVSLFEQYREADDTRLKTLIDTSVQLCTDLVVLIGERTSERYYVSYEIEKGLELRKRIVGFFVHELEDLNGTRSARGRVPRLLEEAGVYCLDWDPRAFRGMLSDLRGGERRVS